MKPIQEDDLSFRSWNPADDEPANRLKDVNLSQVNPATKEEFSCGKFRQFQQGDARTTAERQLSVRDPLEFESRYPSGKLQSASFMDLRPDKKPEFCVASETFAKAKPWTAVKEI